ncbi:MAG TPA: hypothetical protein DCL41_05080 [Bdellovibrionales bacterium]|nr:hypothetical protein [Pseudobdellovibrionaceae bacterium]HAG91220.1 hypothetical protein [Bdellovibrionales bacterium]|tara:strand:+ start:3046 stop:3519 length:474 start_codon:yes stop_codon:yes gene_type:complete
MQVKQFLKQLKTPLNDVVTSTEIPLVFKKIPEIREVSFEKYTYDSDSFSVQKKLHPEIQPLRLPKETEEVFAKAVKVAKETSLMEVVHINEDIRQFEAVATTPLMKFKDDIVVKVEPDEKGSVVHMRSKSRLGKSDLGKNAERIQSFFSVLKKELEL